VGSRTGSLSTFIRAVGCRRATFLRAEDVAVHTETHGASGAVPLESGIRKDLVQSFFFRLLFHGLAAGDDHGSYSARNVMSLDHSGRFSQIFNARVGA